MVNYLAVLAAAVSSMVIGALWYSPILFGKLWMSLSGMDEKKLEEMKKKSMGKSYFIGFLANIVMAYVLSWLIGLTPVTLSSGLMMSAMIWLGFTATSSLGTVLWEGKPLKLYFLNVSYSLVMLLTMGLILSVWV